LSSCLGIVIHIIRPLGFLLDDKKLARAGMDYMFSAIYEVHDSFDAFREACKSKRIIALDVNADIAHHRFQYDDEDILMVGSEQYGFLPTDLQRINHRVKIPMLPQRRSLNMAIAATIVLSEALSQLDSYVFKD
jgi:tRNA (cytidine/uridine-2'-O-)-methyltransferase